ncbi:hypothetical protein F5Y15DRAFT_1776 [Xylariaceae sp. FL0016]|nr:hypothetical protein F5Y15DRAFT_1776 [Xylariaceae sp. FL0016]
MEAAMFQLPLPLIGLLLANLAPTSAASLSWGILPPSRKPSFRHASSPFTPHPPTRFSSDTSLPSLSTRSLSRALSSIHARTSAPLSTSTIAGISAGLVVFVFIVASISAYGLWQRARRSKRTREVKREAEAAVVAAGLVAMACGQNNKPGGVIEMLRHPTKDSRSESGYSGSGSATTRTGSREEAGIRGYWKRDGRPDKGKQPREVPAIQVTEPPPSRKTAVSDSSFKTALVGDVEVHATSSRDEVP